MTPLERILNLLKERKLKQKDLCDYLGVKGQVFTNWKNGHTESWKQYLPEIAEFFSVSVEYILGKTDEKENPTVTGDDEISEYLEELRNRPEMKMLFSLAKGATKEDIEQAVAIIEVLRKGKNG